MEEKLSTSQKKYQLHKIYHIHVSQSQRGEKLDLPEGQSLRLHPLHIDLASKIH